MIDNPKPSETLSLVALLKLSVKDFQYLREIAIKQFSSDSLVNIDKVLSELVAKALAGKAAD